MSSSGLVPTIGRRLLLSFGGFSPAVKGAIQAAATLRPHRAEVEPVFPPTDPLELGVSCRFNDPAFWTRYQRAGPLTGIFVLGHSYELSVRKCGPISKISWPVISADPAAEWASLENLFTDGRHIPESYSSGS